MSRSRGQSETKSPVFSPHASLVLIYRLTEVMKRRVDLAQPEDVWKRDTLPLGLFYFSLSSETKFLKGFLLRDHLQILRDEVTRRFYYFKKIEPKHKGCPNEQWTYAIASE
ncbi:hypothetical protein TNCV_4161111 [Trichonephila clavipes]|nr:hypothetical protein TNCV_4161111 [Trichonephila clavipes]